MRMMFGLVGMLVTIAIIAWMWGFVAHPADTVRAGATARTTAAQIAGVDAATGMPATASAKFSPVEKGGRVDGLLVESVVPGGPMWTYFGLRPNDVITEIGQSGRVRDIALSGGEEMASALAFEAFQRKWELVVLRDGAPLTLPIKGVATTAAPLTPGAPSPTGAIDPGFDLTKPIPSH